MISKQLNPKKQNNIQIWRKTSKNLAKVFAKLAHAESWPSIRNRKVN